MVSRRMILTTGAASIVVIGGGIAARSILTSDLTEARQPWVTAGEDFGDARLNALAYAILAPNPHNRQPWMIRLDGDSSMTLFCDLNRLLPETDPPNRQIVIGLGAFLELLRQAAAENGYRLDVKSFPQGEPQPVLDERPVAQVTLIKDATVEKDPLFNFALTRRTIRTQFDQNKPVGAEILMAINAVLRPDDGVFAWAGDGANVTALKDICNRGWLIEAQTKRTHRESTALTRIGEKEINQNPDGISLGGPFFEGARAVGFLTRDAMNEQGSRAHAENIKFYQHLIDSAMAFGWLNTNGNSRLDQLNAGAGWIRIHLAATEFGLAMQPLSQVLQEFPEMDDLYKELHDHLGIEDPSRVQGLFRFGYAKFPGAAPRWPLESRIIEAR